MTTPTHDGDSLDTMLDPRCACGHVLDEHDSQWACMVDDCECFYFDEEPG